MVSAQFRANTTTGECNENIKQVQLKEDQGAYAFPKTV